jgi:hypothetical protein
MIWIWRKLLTAPLEHSTKQHARRKGAGSAMLCSTRRAEADVRLLPASLTLKHHVRRKQEGMPNVVDRILH